MRISKLSINTIAWWALLVVCTLSLKAQAQDKHLVYIVSDTRIPFWNIMAAGVRHGASSLGYSLSVYSADNQARKELELTAAAISNDVQGIILSPTNSSAAVTVLKLADKASIPVVVLDVGADTDNLVSYIKSNNYQGAYQLGIILASALVAEDWDNGTVGIIAIPQKRSNGKARTEGFLAALEESGIRSAGMLQQSDFSYQETYTHARTLISKNPDLRAIWLQGSNRYRAALDAIVDAGKKDDILLISFDAEPEFIEMIAQGTLVAAGMQQPFLMGENAVAAMDRHLHGLGVQKVQQVGVLPVSSQNLDQLLPLIRRNVLGQRGKD